jgi:SAM-dependent methyltransferase
MTSPTQGAAPPPGASLQQMASGHFLAQALYTAAVLGVADALRNGPKSAREIACEVGAHAPSLTRVLRLLASAGIFDEREDGAFDLTPLGDLLRSDAPSSQRVSCMLVNSPTAFRAWAALLHTVTTGQTAFDHVFGMGAFEYFQQHPDEGEIFNRAMSSGAAAVAESVVAAYDFTRFRRILDVGGGYGALIAAILKAAPEARGILFELPSVAEGAQLRLAAAGLDDRCDVVGGDVFDGVPSSADAIVLKHIIHDWDDDRALAILKACHAAIAPQGALLIIESVFPARIDASLATRAVGGPPPAARLRAGRRKFRRRNVSVSAKTRQRWSRTEFPRFQLRHD